MYCTRNVTDELVWIGGNDRRLSLFEGAYAVPEGMSYNAYLLKDEKTVLVDTVDNAVRKVFFENLKHALNGRKLDYIIVQHMEPDHSATLEDALAQYPEATLVCNGKILTMIRQFFHFTAEDRVLLVGEGDTLPLGKHTLQFFMAPMVHWPEVMVTFDTLDKLLFSADAFGSFGALDGALFADEVDFAADHMNAARRYYCNIVGKYGMQVQALLKKLPAVEMICPLHGHVWRTDLSLIVDKYAHWSTYEPEEKGVVIAYASVYGNTANAADILACLLRDRGVKTRVLDVSVKSNDAVITEAFRFSHLVFASTTYNAGIFVRMEEVLSALASHGIRNRTVALIQNGSWAPASGKLMAEKLAGCKNMTLLEETVTIHSSLKERGELEKLADALAASVHGGATCAN